MSLRRFLSSLIMADLASAYGAAPDFTDQYNTPLSSQEEAAFQKWRATLPTNLRNTSDYDLRGAWKANARAAANGHLPDTWKKPNHATFSTGSIYSTPDMRGGTWDDGSSPNNYIYEASPVNVRNMGMGRLAQYFLQFEHSDKPTKQHPNSVVIFPGGYSLPDPRWKN